MNESFEEKTASDVVLERIGRRQEQAAVVNVEEETIKVVIFSLQGHFYGFYGESVKKLMPPQPVYYVPGSPDFIPGVINVRGQIESVLNITRFLGLPDAQKGGSSRIAVAEKNGIRSGILVDSVEDVVDIPMDSIKPPLGTLPTAIKEFMSGEFIYRDSLVILLDIGAIFRKITQ
jgi:purine-binding chemotaxis protein CheW